MDERTCDRIYDGKITLVQHQKGYRFGTDALLLATDLPALEAGSRVVELGAAHGPVALTIAAFHPHVEVLAIERQEALYALLVENIALNGLANIEARQLDLRHHRTAFDAHIADLVVFNPPYYRSGARRPSQCPERAEAHHELHGTLEDFFAAARYLLKPGGYLKMIAPPLRMSDVFEAVKNTDLRIESLRCFHSSGGREAYLVEWVMRRGGAPDLKIRPPLYIYADEDVYTDEVARRLGKKRRHGPVGEER
jgi:tRNA1Val (adenine37-N6)-methyltransferase